MPRIVFWILVLIFVLPAAGLGLLRYKLGDPYTNLRIHGSYAEEAARRKPEVYKIEGLEKVLNTTARGEVRDGFKSLTKFNDLDAPRLIVFSVWVEPKVLLKENEDLPDDDFLDVFVEARSVKYGQDECLRLSEILTSECVLKGSHTNRIRGGYYKMTFALSFVQKSDFGTIGSGEQVSYQEIKHTFKTPERRIDYSGKVAEEERVKLYKKIRKQCDLLVDRQGNCAITQINLSVHRNFGAKRKEFSLSEVVYSLLHSDGKVRKTSDFKNGKSAGNG